MAYRIEAGAGIEREARLAAGAADRLQRAMDVRAGLEMGGDDIGAGSREGLDIGIDRRDHQMHVHDALDVRPDCGAHRRTEGEVRHEMAVHYIDMHPVAALGLDGAAFGAEIGEIGGEDRGGDLDTAIEGHGNAPWG